MYVEHPCEPCINGIQPRIPLNTTLAPSGEHSLHAFRVEVYVEIS